MLISIVYEGTMKQLPIIGRTANASFANEGSADVPVKIDTGADGSSIWASDIRINDEGVLSFALFGPSSPFYTGSRHETSEFDARLVRSSNGATQLRYQVRLIVQLAGRRVKGTFTLADRSRNIYPVLVGCKLLRGKFLVDVAKDDARIPKPPSPRARTYTEELRQNPQAFFEKYHLNNPSGDLPHENCNP